ncbi:MAG: GNAT family N-acetyltransferase [Actinomycetota bacterium]
MTELRYLEQTPAIGEFRALRERAGLSSKTQEAAAAGLPNTLHAVCVRDGDRLVGMGRVVGDGGLNFEIVDMAVDPDHQRQGIGYRVMELLMAYVHRTAAPSAYVSLIADDGAPALYAKFGFAPTAPASIGMSVTID